MIILTKNGRPEEFYTYAEKLSAKKIDEISEEEIDIYKDIKYAEGMSTELKAILLKSKLRLSLYFRIPTILTNNVPIVKEFKKYENSNKAIVYSLSSEIGFFYDFSESYIKEKVFPYLDCVEFFFSLPGHIVRLEKFFTTRGFFTLDYMILEEILKYLENLEESNLREKYIDLLESWIVGGTVKGNIYTSIIFRFPELKIRLLDK